MTKVAKALFSPICGTTTVGERGQVVIPAEIRKLMKLVTGDKLLVFCKFDQVIGLIKAENLDKFLDKISTHVMKGVKNFREKIKGKVS